MTSSLGSVVCQNGSQNSGEQFSNQITGLLKSSGTTRGKRGMRQNMEEYCTVIPSLGVPPFSNLMCSTTRNFSGPHTSGIFMEISSCRESIIHSISNPSPLHRVQRMRLKVLGFQSCFIFLVTSPHPGTHQELLQQSQRCSQEISRDLGVLCEPLLSTSSLSRLRDFRRAVSGTRIKDHWNKSSPGTLITQPLRCLVCAFFPPFLEQDESHFANLKQNICSAFQNNQCSINVIHLNPPQNTQSHENKIKCG